MLGYDTLYRSACPVLSIQVNTMLGGPKSGCSEFPPLCGDNIFNWRKTNGGGYPPS